MQLPKIGELMRRMCIKVLLCAVEKGAFFCSLDGQWCVNSRNDDEKRTKEMMMDRERRIDRQRERESNGKGQRSFDLPSLELIDSTVRERERA